MTIAIKAWAKNACCQSTLRVRNAKSVNEAKEIARDSSLWVISEYGLIGELEDKAAVYAELYNWDEEEESDWVAAQIEKMIAYKIYKVKNAYADCFTMTEDFRKNPKKFISKYCESFD